jgi:RecQ family ATP-dependent DNA helicase
MLWTDKVKKYLTKYWNIDSLKDKQIEVINELINGNDVIGLLPTGYGKSMCYLIPPLVTRKTMIIISPLISLMDDQKTNLINKGVKASALHCNNKNKDEETFSIIDGKIKIVYMSPEYLVKGNGKELVSILVENDRLGFIAIDEAHCISSWGHDFRPEYKEIKMIRKDYPDIPILAVTATATEHVCNDIKINLELKKCKVIKASFDRPNLYLKVCIVPTQETIVKKKIVEKPIAKEILVQKYIEKYKDHKLIIYVNSRKDTDELSKDINKINNNVELSEAYHAGLSSKVREKIHFNFINGKTNIIVSTIAFGMGIDNTVRCVIIFGCDSIEQYVQEAGRAGRDGLAAETIFYFDKKQYMIKKQMTLKSYGKYGQLCKIKLDNLAKVWSFAFTNTCKRKYMLDYFNETTNYITCNNCSSCCEEKLIDLTKQFNTILLNEKNMVKTMNQIKSTYFIKTDNEINNILWNWKNYVIINKLDINNLDECMKLKFNKEYINISNITHNTLSDSDTQNEDKYTLYFDGASKGNPGIAGAGAVIYDNNKKEVWSSSIYVGVNETNNMAEYNGLLLGLTKAVEMKINNLVVKGDSELIIKQMKGEYKVSAANLKYIYTNAKNLEKHITNICYKHIYREKNTVADRLANEGLTKNKTSNEIYDNMYDKLSKLVKI